MTELGGHDLSAGAGVLEHVTQCARRALVEYDGAGPGQAGSGDGAVTLLSVSENATFLVTGPDGGQSILRVHRLGYHSPAAIESELAWMDALRAEAGIRTPRVLPAADGSRVVAVGAAGGGRAVGEGEVMRHCVRFEFLPGEEPVTWGEAGVRNFERLGAITAAMHAHARAWRRPPGFTRFRWAADDAFGDPASGAPGRWGDWRAGVGVGPAEAETLGRLESRLRDRLRAYGTGPERFGLIHADTRLANLLVHGTTTAVIDFDDCGLGWYLYDLASSVSFFEDSASVPDLVDGWLAGYQRAGGVLTGADMAEAWTLIAFRRLLLTAWVGSHPAAAGAADLGADFTTGSCELAERYLSGTLPAFTAVNGSWGRGRRSSGMAGRES